MKALATSKLSELFEVSYGTKFDLKQMTVASVDDGEGIAFVSRSAKNLGIVAHVRPYRGIDPLRAGLITVALGGTYLLSAFVQDSVFYTAQNVAVLTPRLLMTRATKLYYCLCIGKNRFKYSAFGREANRSLKDLIVPTLPPEWINTEDAMMAESEIDSKPLLESDVTLEVWPETSILPRPVVFLTSIIDGIVGVAT